MPETVATPARAAAATSRQPPVAARWLGGIGAGVVLVLLAAGSGYGYHRDELYFLRAGQEPAFGYVDQPPLTPLLARLATAVFGDSLLGLRVLPALAAGTVVVVTGMVARDLGARRAAQALAAACMAVSAVLLAAGHLHSTTAFDLLAWTAVSWLVVRALRRGRGWWLWAGLAAGVGLENKTLVVFLLAGLLAGVAVTGPRAVLRDRWFWGGAAVALALWLPNLAWQAANGWPQVELSRAIASGSSGTSEDRVLFVPFQLVLVSPLLVPVWAAGLWRLARDPRLRTWRSFAWAYGLLALAFVLSGGKPYYLAGLYPVLLAAGAPAAVAWAGRGAVALRRSLLGAALVLSALVSSLLMLPLVPADQLRDTPVPDVNYDAGETIGWPRLARTVAAVHASLPEAEQGRAVVLTRNYGEAGAVDRFLPELSPAYSGHNGYHAWGPPPESATTAVVVGFDRATLERWFGSVRQAATVDNGVGLDNDEQGVPVWVGQERRSPWSDIWPDVRRLG